MSTLKQDAAQQALYEVEFDLNEAILKQLKKLTPEEFTELLGAIPKLADKLVEEFV
jgi:restriction endonuclease Mrr